MDIPAQQPVSAQSGSSSTSSGVPANPAGESTMASGVPPQPPDQSQATPSSPTIEPSPLVTVIEPESPPEVAQSAPPPPPPVATPSLIPGATGMKQSLLDVLLANGTITAEQHNQLKLQHISENKPIDLLLKEKDIVTEEQLYQAKALLNNVGFTKISETGTDPQALSQLPESVARNYRMLPLSYNKNEGVLTVAMEDPLDLSAIEFAKQKTGLRVVATYATPSEIDQAIAAHYSQTLSSEVSAALEQTSQVAQDKAKKEDFSALSGETIREAPITKIVQTVLSFAIKARASDIHIEPQESRTRVRYRIDGILSEKLILPRSVHDAVVSRIKIMSGLKIDEKRLPQDGRFSYSGDDQDVDLRVSTLPTIHNEKIVMRLLRKDEKVPAIKDLGMDGLALKNVNDAIHVPHGIVLVTGPTGSGKTTTLYSILHQINTPKVNIMTLEDPVEYQMPGINQVQINPQAGLTFASGLRSFLRQDPNIIMVGEIRDSETAELAIQAALTGHLVFSTLHTSSAAGALPRLLDMGAEPFLLASSMTMVAAQRVVRQLHPDFKEEYKPDPAVLEDIINVLGPHFENYCKQEGKKPEDITLFRPSQNRPNDQPEYKGRIGIFEVMKVTEEIGRLILQQKSAADLENAALKDGMRLMKQDGYIKALRGVTTIEEVLRVAQT